MAADWPPLGELHWGSLVNVLCYSFMWCTLYFTLCLMDSRRSYEWHCRMVTALHAITVSAMTAWSAFVQGPWPFTDVGGPNTPLQTTTTEVCLGYFLFDISWCLYYNSEDALMLVHHLCSIVGMVVTVLSGYYGTELMAAIFGSELTNPFLQTRWFLREVGRYETWYGEVVDHIFMFGFGFMRIGVGTCFLYSYFQQETDFWGRLASLVLYGISWLFWISIMQYAKKKYTRKFAKWHEAKAIASKDSQSHSRDNSATQENGQTLADKNFNNSVSNDSERTVKNGSHLILGGDSSSGVTLRGQNSSLSNGNCLRQRADNSNARENSDCESSENETQKTKNAENTLKGQSFKINPSEFISSCVDPSYVDPMLSHNC